MSANDEDGGGDDDDGVCFVPLWVFSRAQAILLLMKKTYCCLFSSSASSRRRRKRWDILRARVNNARTEQRLFIFFLFSPLPLDAKIKKRERLKYISFKWRTSRYEWTGIVLRRVDDWHHLTSIEIDGCRREKERETQRKTHYRFHHRTEMSDSVEIKREKIQWKNCAGVTKEKEFSDSKLCEERATGESVLVKD